MSYKPYTERVTYKFIIQDEEYMVVTVDTESRYEADHLIEFERPHTPLLWALTIQDGDWKLDENSWECMVELEGENHALAVEKFFCLHGSPEIGNTEDPD